MKLVLEVGSTNYADDLLLIKKSLSHIETLVGTYNGYVLSEPSSKFGWTFFCISANRFAFNRSSSESSLLNLLSHL